MPPSDDRRSEPGQTDEALEHERGRTDEELVERSLAAAEDADEVVRQARDRARAVIDLARGREVPRAATAADVARARALEDLRLDDEYAAADLALRDERERRRLAMRQLLALERGTTDHMLAIERAAHDRLGIGRDSIDMIVHDLRSMLSAITLGAATLVLATEQSAPTRNVIDGIQRAAAQMELLLADLQELAAIERGRARTVLERCDLLDVVRTAVEIHRAAASTNGLTLTTQLPSDAVPLRIDAPRFMRVITNLLANAIKFTPRGGTIGVAVAQTADAAELTVANSGPGIPSELHETIFERFQQGTQLPGHARGVGLGLYIARSIVAAHGGTIAVESEPDQGVTFRVRLPVSAPAP